MKCPRCGNELTTDYDRPPTSCPCGWGVVRPPRRREETFEGSEPANGSMLVFLWILTLLFTVGGYYAIDYFWRSELGAHPRWPWMYAGSWLGYILLCFFFRQPSIDGLRTRDMIFDDPTTLRDDEERFKFDIAFVMMPGKLVCYMIYSTWILLRGQ